MQDSILYILLGLLCVIIYLLLKQGKYKQQDRNNEEIDKIKDIYQNIKAFFELLTEDMSPMNVLLDMMIALMKIG